MHHSIKINELKQQRDDRFAAWWERETKHFQSVQQFRDLAEVAFERGFNEGIVLGAQHGARSAAAVISSDVREILEGGTP